MANTPIRNIRVSPEVWEAWGQNGNSAGLSRTELILNTMTAAGYSVLGNSAGTIESPSPEPNRPVRSVRKAPCVHRVPPTSYCRTCDE